jgi:diguanylate cyclase (GGDEF)-like protein
VAGPPDRFHARSDIRLDAGHGLNSRTCVATTAVVGPDLHASSAPEGPDRSLLRRVLAASATDIARGGEHGASEWLLSVLVIAVVAFGAFAVHRTAGQVDRASQRTAIVGEFSDHVAQAQTFATIAVTHPSDANANRRLLESVATLEQDLARSSRDEGRTVQLQPVVDRVVVSARGVAKSHQSRLRIAGELAALSAGVANLGADLGAQGRALSAEKRTRTFVALFGGLLLVALLMWSFSAKRTRKALESSAARFREDLRWQAFHDALTGLPNRSLFEDRVSHALERLRRYNEQVAVLFVDLDDFKTVNDSLGHAVGDRALQEFAVRLGECTRRADTAARFGGDEFVVLVEGPNAAFAAHGVADRIHEALERPLALEGHDVFMHASIGMAVGDAKLTADELIRNADIAMYAAKDQGKKGSALFEPSMHMAARKRLQLSTDLRRALQEDQLTVKYQPLMRIADGKMVGAEALARWTHETLGEIPPVDFIPLAEETGMIVSIGRYVLHQACMQLRKWQDEHPDNHPDYVSVNLSVRQFQPPGQVVEDVKEAAAASGLHPRHLMLEITESILMSDRDSMINDLTALRELGARIAIDDFGTGYSALSYLRQFPIDTVKMDRSFVRDLGQGKADSALIRSVVELGEALEMQIVAEGIEGQDQLDSVSGLRCDIAQGFYFYPPLDAEALGQALSEPWSVPLGVPETA